MIYHFNMTPMTSMTPVFIKFQIPIGEKFFMVIEVREVIEVILSLLFSYLILQEATV